MDPELLLMPESRHDELLTSDRTTEFVGLLLEHQRRIHAYIATMLTNWADADEVLQETSTVLWKKFGEFQRGTDFAAWAFRIAYFCTMSFLQKHKQRALQFSESSLEKIAAATEALQPELEAQFAALAGCMEKLGDRDRDLLQRRYFPGSTTKKVADSLDRPLKSVYKSLNRIYAALLACIQRNQSHEELA
jgi:RNA polymerase sigma-70 factor, ECF subfamily